MTTFINPKRVCGTITEGHGEHRTTHRSYEILCPICGKWTKNFGQTSIGDTDDKQEWICDPCATLPESSQ